MKALLWDYQNNVEQYGAWQKRLRQQQPALPAVWGVTPFVTALAGNGLLMVVAQIPHLSRYARLKFSLATWAFIFSWAAVASTLLFLIDAEPVTGGRAFSYLVLAAISVLVAAIAGRTVVAISQGRLLPPAAAPSTPTPTP
jgi:tellurite resistance protein